MAQWLFQIGMFAIIFALPCVMFVLSTIVAEELRDFCESTGLSLTAHMIISVFLALGSYRLMLAIVTPEQFNHFGLIIHIAYALTVGAWLFGANGCLYGDSAPSKRIGPRGIKRYR